MIKEFWLLVGREFEGSAVRHYFMLSNTGERKQLTFKQFIGFENAHKVLNATVAGQSLKGKDMNLNFLPKFEKVGGQLVQTGGLTERQIIDMAKPLIAKVLERNRKEAEASSGLSDRTKGLLDKGNKLGTSGVVTTLAAVPGAVGGCTTGNPALVVGSMAGGVVGEAKSLGSSGVLLAAGASAVGDAAKSGSVRGAAQTAKEFGQYYGASLVNSVKGTSAGDKKAAAQGVKAIGNTVAADGTDGAKKANSHLQMLFPDED